MEERRHSLDVPISKTLLALRRVRSLRDPSTNSVSKPYGPVDNLIWNTNTLNSITLACGDSDVENEMDHKPVPKFKDGGLYGQREGLANDLGLVNVPYQKAVTEKDSVFCNGCISDKGLALTCIPHSSNFVGGIGSCKELDRKLLQGDSIDQYVSTWKSEQRKQTRSYRMADNISNLDSPCLIASEGLSGNLLIGNEDVDYVDRECACGISSCWSGTARFRESGSPSRRENQPLVSGEICEIRKGKVFKYLENNFSQNLDNPQSLTQKFRPRSFSDLTGHNLIVHSLLNAISSARIGSLYIFHGPCGTGKTSASKIFAAALNCLALQEDKPCGLCRECVFFFSGRSRDVMEVDSVRINYKNRIRSLIKHCTIPPVSSQFKVFIIDECHLLQEETWLTLLNKLADLPQHIVFVMVTPDLSKLPQCIISLSAVYHFPKINEALIAGRLEKICREEGLEFEHNALSLIASKSNGSLRDAEMTLEHLSLLGEKITTALVYKLTGVVSDDDVLNLLDLALSSDSSKTIRRARELMKSGIDPMQLISQLANLVMDILAGKCNEGSSEIRRRFFSTHNSEASLKQLSNALKILSEAEKQLKMSKCQATWLTVALLQFSSVECSFMESSDLGSCKRTSHQRDGDFCSRSSTSESLKHVAPCDCHDNKLPKLELQDNKETLQAIWKRVIETCQSNSLKRFLKKQGNLFSVCFNQGVAVAHLEFHRRSHVKKAEKSWKLIASTLQDILGCNVEIRISLVHSAPTTKSAETKKACSRFFNCTHKSLCEGSPSTSEIESESLNTSKSASEKTIRDKSLKFLQNCFLRNKRVGTIRSNQDNALSIDMKSNGNCESKHEQVVEQRPYWFSRFLKLRKKANSSNASHSPCARSETRHSTSTNHTNPTEAYLAFCT